MKLVFLGTSHGAPTTERACSCTLLEVGGAIYYIDGGVPIAERTMLCGREISAARAMFVTHTHSDHIGGVYQFASLLNWYYKSLEFSFYMPESNAAEAICNLINITDSKTIDLSRIQFLTASAGTVYEDENIKVSYHKTMHLTAGERVSYGMVIEAEGKRICFSGDLSQWLVGKDFPEAAYDDIDLLICEMAHFGREHLDPYLPKIKAKKVAFTHVYPLSKYDDIADIAEEYSFDVLTPSDMEEIEI